MIWPHSPIEYYIRELFQYFFLVAFNHWTWQYIRGDRNQLFELIQFVYLINMEIINIHLHFQTGIFSLKSIHFFIAIGNGKKITHYKAVNLISKFRATKKNPN